jgi:2-polyprenyl-3-methyl-5-hydroxy-6-metoxy-1,4-benzoquinol methylase
MVESAADSNICRLLYMNQRAFEEIHSAEGSWWYDGRIFLIQRLLRKFGAHDEEICDIGAGYGAMCSTFKPFGRTAAFEPNPKARAFCADNCDKVLEADDLTKLVLRRPQFFSLISILDVVEHVDDDIGFLNQLNLLIKPGGHLLVTVPAYMALGASSMSSRCTIAVMTGWALFE